MAELGRVDDRKQWRQLEFRPRETLRRVGWNERDAVPVEIREQVVE
jgi:hypothetical protein